MKNYFIFIGMLLMLAACGSGASSTKATNANEEDVLTKGFQIVMDAGSSGTRVYAYKIEPSANEVILISVF